MNSLNHLFYTFKPYIPRALQISIRRRIAQYKRRKHAHIWPIDPASATPPPGWTGWPDGKKFALVLSHDVDNQKGQERILDLAKLEMKLGFRSAFNFVPERYTNHEKIKRFLRENGFEIGVHGLKHDGKLFENKNIFDRRAEKINRYLQEWGSTGFTSPSMHHKLSWMHSLDITHSISTFDTDPFEPQPDPVGTIFPFLVHKNSEDSAAKLPDSFSLPPRPKASHNAGSVSSQPPGLQASRLPIFFIELPYTMPQDHLLFIILQEKKHRYLETKIGLDSGKRWNGPIEHPFGLYEFQRWKKYIRGIFIRVVSRIFEICKAKVQTIVLERACN